jgi:predicted ATPase
MKLLAFEFEDRTIDWKLERVEFSDFNLLVGPSAAGKTRILNALYHAVNAVAPPESHMRHLRRLVHAEKWTMTFEHAGAKYHWEFESSIQPEPTSATIKENDGINEDEDGEEEEEEEQGLLNLRREILKERIVKNDSEDLIVRDRSRLSYMNQETPKLNPAESAISLIVEPPIAAIREGLRRVHMSRAQWGAPQYIESYDEAKVMRLKQRYKTADQIASASGLSTMMKIFLTQANAPEVFHEVVEALRESFPVEHIEIRPMAPAEQREGLAYFFGPGSILGLFVKETGVGRVLSHWELSAGMLRTMMHLFELAVSPPGTVVLIDEYENGLGINCMEQLTDYLLRRTPNVQFIITSHHPYIINNIPISSWKLVRRSGNVVKVIPSSNVPALTGKSNLDAFTRLLNSPEYLEPMVQ